MLELQDVSIYFPVVPLLFLFISLFGKGPRKPYLLPMMALLVCSLLVDLYVKYWNGIIANTLLLQVFTGVECCCYSLYFLALFRKPNPRKFIITTLVFFECFKVVDILYLTGPNRLDNEAIVLESLLLVGYSVCYLLQQLNAMELKQPHTFPPFWICAGIIFYFSGNLVLFLFSEYVVSQGLNYYAANWIIHFLFSLLKYIAFTIGIYFSWDQAKFRSLSTFLLSS